MINNLNFYAELSFENEFFAKKIMEQNSKLSSKHLGKCFVLNLVTLCSKRYWKERKKKTAFIMSAILSESIITVCFFFL